MSLPAGVRGRDGRSIEEERRGALRASRTALGQMVRVLTGGGGRFE